MAGPVIVGIGQVANKDPERLVHPVDLLEDATRLAIDDAGADVLPHVGMVLSSPLSIFTEEHGGAMVAERLGLQPGPRIQASYSGAGPQRNLMQACAAIAAGELDAALLVGGCGGGSSGGSSSTAPAGGAKEGGKPKKATAPNAPAGSKVVSCAENSVETEQLRATEVDCATARTTMRRWESSHACTLGKGSSRSSCSLGGFRCQAVRAGSNASVSCARPGGAISFIARSWLLKKAG